MKQETIIAPKLLVDTRQIIEAAQQTAYRLADLTLVRRNWLLGQRIAQEELGVDGRANYGAEVIKDLSNVLTKEYGRGFTKTNLYTFVQFYKLFPNIFHSVSGKFEKSLSAGLKSVEENAVSSAFIGNLSWTHYRTLLQVPDKEARDWYAAEAAHEGWGVRTLQRNISSQYRKCFRP